MKRAIGIKTLWGYIKKNVVLDLGHRIRQQKDGIRIPHDRHLEEIKMKDNFDAISSLFGQLDLEFMMGDNAIQEDNYYNDMLIDVLNDHFTKYVKNPNHRFTLEKSMGFDGDSLSMKEIADRLDTTEGNS